MPAHARRANGLPTSLAQLHGMRLAESSVRRSQHKSLSANVVKHRRLKRFVDLTAQLSHVNVHEIGLGVKLIVPDFLEKQGSKSAPPLCAASCIRAERIRAVAGQSYAHRALRCVSKDRAATGPRSGPILGFRWAAAEALPLWPATWPRRQYPMGSYFLEGPLSSRIETNSSAYLARLCEEPAGVRRRAEDCYLMAQLTISRARFPAR